MKYKLILILTIFIALFSTSCCVKVTDLNPKEITTSSLKRMVKYDRAWSKMPYYVKIHIFTNRGYAGGCTGNIITKEVVLTAAHCLDTAKTILIEKYNGMFFMSKDFHYPDIYQSVSTDGDIGVIIFNETISENPVPLMTSKYLESGEISILGGFRVTRERRKANVFEVGKLIIAGLTDEHIITRYTGLRPDHYPCFGSSGGGALGIRIKNWKINQVGLISVVSKGGWICDTPGAYTYHTKIDKYLDFILQYAPDVELI